MIQQTVFFVMGSIQLFVGLLAWANDETWTPLTTVFVVVSQMIVGAFAIQEAE